MNKIKELWEEIVIFHEQVVWQNSKERKELAVERIEALRRGENLYKDLY